MLRKEQFLQAILVYQVYNYRNTKILRHVVDYFTGWLYISYIFVGVFQYLQQLQCFAVKQLLWELIKLSGSAHLKLSRSIKSNIKRDAADSSGRSCPHIWRSVLQMKSCERVKRGKKESALQNQTYFTIGHSKLIAYSLCSRVTYLTLISRQRSSWKMTRSGLLKHVTEVSTLLFLSFIDSGQKFDVPDRRTDTHTRWLVYRLRIVKRSLLEFFQFLTAIRAASRS